MSKLCFEISLKIMGLKFRTFRDSKAVSVNEKKHFFSNFMPLIIIKDNKHLHIDSVKNTRNRAKY